LEAEGHLVRWPTLTGLGERAHLLNRFDVDLEAHVADVVGVIEFNELHDVVLVGHSYGGMVITGAAARVADRIAHMVYLDAVVPCSGESHFDMCDPGRREDLQRLIATQGGGRVVPGRGSGLAYFGITDPVDAAWVEPRLSDQPAGTFSQPLGDVSAIDALPKTYLRFTQSGLVPRESEARAQAFDYRSLDVPHDAMVTHPEVLARELLSIA
jgi:pimeloyl-ACP methyl ester carboxylesterase